MSARRLALLLAALASPAMAGEAELADLLARKAAILATMHQKASKGLVAYAQDAIFAEYFLARPEDRPEAKRRIDITNQAAQATSRVEEMCLIDEKGREISRIFNHRAVADADLHDDEDDAIFFKPTFALAAGQVFVSPLYLSDDSDKWVVGYATPIVAGKKKPAILHIEYSLADYQAALTRDVGGEATYVLALDPQGYVVADSRAAIPVAGKPGKTGLADSFRKLAAPAAAAIRLGAEGKGSFAEGGHTWRVVFKPVRDWTVVAVERQ